jgi:hypothetical protein
MEERDVLNQPKNGIHFRLFLAVMLHQRGKTQPSIRTSSSLHSETRTSAIMLLQTQLLLAIPPPIAPNNLSHNSQLPASLPQFRYIQLSLLTLPHRTIHPSPKHQKEKNQTPEKNSRLMIRHKHRRPHLQRLLAPSPPPLHPPPLRNLKHNPRRGPHRPLEHAGRRPLAQPPMARDAQRDRRHHAVDRRGHQHEPGGQDAGVEGGAMRERGGGREGEGDGVEG